jgi:hypothetical protein
VLKKNFGRYTLRVNGGNEAGETECSHRQGTEQSVARNCYTPQFERTFCGSAVDSRGTEKRTVIVRAENTETTEGKFISLWII